MTATETSARPDSHDMIVVHRAFRRESSLLPRLVRAVPDRDVSRARVISGHFRDYRLGLHEHHTGEDGLVWPLLLARVDLEAELVLRMEAQHEAVAATLDRAEALAAAWERSGSRADGERLAAVLDEHRAALLEHLDDEERYVLSLIEEHLTAAEWNRLAERFATETPKDKLLFFLGALLEEATAPERAKVLRELPLVARVVWWTVGRRQYARRVRNVRAGL